MENKFTVNVYLKLKNILSYSNKKSLSSLFIFISRNQNADSEYPRIRVSNTKVLRKGHVTILKVFSLKQYGVQVSWKTLFHVIGT